MTWEDATSLIGATFACAVVLNAVEAFVDPDGWLWTALRVTVSGAFVIAVVVGGISYSDRRRDRAAGG
jgi:hypothetical protein